MYCSPTGGEGGSVGEWRGMGKGMGVGDGNFWGGAGVVML